jgi:hypothetical protein
VLLPVAVEVTVELEEEVLETVHTGLVLAADELDWQLDGEGELEEWEEEVMEAVDDKLLLADTEFDEHGEGDGEPEEDTELDDERVHG